MIRASLCRFRHLEVIEHRTQSSMTNFNIDCLIPAFASSDKTRSPESVPNQENEAISIDDLAYGTSCQLHLHLKIQALVLRYSSQ